LDSLLVVIGVGLSEADVPAITAFANQAGIAIENSQAEETIRRHAARTEALLRTAARLNTQLDLDTVLRAVCEETARALNVPAAWINLFDEQRDVLDFASAFGLPPEFGAGHTPTPRALHEECARRMGPLLVFPDVQTLSAIPNADQYAALNIRTIASASMLREGELIGVLSVVTFDEVRHFVDDELELLTGLANQAVQAISNGRLYQAEERRASDAATIGTIAQALNASPDLESVFAVVARELPRLSTSDRLSLALLNGDRQHFTMYALSGEQDTALGPGVTMPVEATAAADDVLAGRAHLTPDLSTDLQYPADRALYEAGLRSRLNLPLKLGEEVLGSLNLGSRQPNAFTPDRLPAFLQVADAVAAAVQNARLYEETRRRNWELALLNRVITASAARQEVEGILEMVCRELALAFGVPQSAAALFNAEKTEAVVVAEYVAEGRPPSLGEVIPVVGNPGSQHLLEHKTPLLIENAQTDPRQAPIHDLMRQRGTVSLLVLPLLIEGEVVGSLGVDAIEYRRFSEEEIELASRVAAQVSGALARARLVEAQRRLSTAVEQVAESMVVTDAKGHILYTNPAFERVSRYRAAEVVGQHLRILASSKHSAEIYREMWQTVMAGRVWQGRMINQNKMGSLYTVDATISPVRDQAGKVINYVTTMRDVTRELQLEEQFHQAQKMEALGRLAGGIAHDFNNC
jgi:PAS domain S-box-containing protein